MRFNQMIRACGLKWVVSSLLLMLLTAACVPATQTRPAQSDQRPHDVVQTDGSQEDNWIDELIAGKSASEAVFLLERKARQSSGSEAFQLLAKAAELALPIESSADIDRRLTQLNQDFPGASYAMRQQILLNRVRLYRKQAAAVLNAIRALETQATPTETLALQDLKASALQLAGFAIDSVRIRIKLADKLEAQSTAAARNNRLLWESLLGVQPETIRSLISEIPDTFSAWLELADLTLTNKNNSLLFDQELNQWVSRHPQHPANRDIVGQIRKKQIATSAHPDRVALILPLSGKLAGVGQAIRDGFLAAYMQTNRTVGVSMKIDIHDTQGDADLAAQAIQQANQQGAKFIVGPLSKAAVRKAAASPANLLPMLVLNRLSDSIVEELSTEATNAKLPLPGNEAPLYQFALAPETEARQVAERGSLDGHQNAMVIVPENVWGNRVYEAFTRRYEALGGQVLTRQVYKKGVADYSDIIQRGLNLNLSKLRYQQLKSSLYRDIKFTPRKRADIDMIFLAASPEAARQIKPQLRFFYADKIPVYATSHIYSGIPRPGKDKDLDNIRFADMPWVIGRAGSATILRTLINRNWPKRAAKYTRFHALGVDSFHLLPQLGWLGENPGDWLSGFTGRLSVDQDKRIVRDLNWATFKKGSPALLTGPQDL